MLRFKHHITNRAFLFREVFIKGTTEHLLDDFLCRGFLRDRCRIDELAVTHHGVFFTDFQNLVESMGNEYNCDIFRFPEALYNLKQLFCFCCAQRCCRLIQNQEITIDPDGSCDQYHLLLCKRKVLYQCVHIDIINV